MNTLHQSLTALLAKLEEKEVLKKKILTQKTLKLRNLQNTFVIVLLKSTQT